MLPGIRADYMRQFKEYLEDEGLPNNDDRIEFILPVINNLGKVAQPLKTIRLKDGIDFKRSDKKPTLGLPVDRLARSRVTLDWYPKIQAQRSKGADGPMDLAEKQEAVLTAKHLAFMDMDEVYRELQLFKNERSWFNLNLPRDAGRTLLGKLTELKRLITTGKLKDLEFGNLHAIAFDRHLYEPLICINSELVDVRPVSLNPGERDFVLDLRWFHENKRPFFKDRELYLLRNRSRGKGIGFFEAGNFYPDFILWLVTGGRQYVSFVDPKGIRNLQGQDDPKISFHATIKDLETRLSDPKVILNSFILSVTPYQSPGWWHSQLTEAQFNDRHVFFRKPDTRGHVEAILATIVR